MRLMQPPQVAAVLIMRGDDVASTVYQMLPSDPLQVRQTEYPNGIHAATSPRRPSIACGHLRVP
jgi:hypothetical protein